MMELKLAGTGVLLLVVLLGPDLGFAQPSLAPPPSPRIFRAKNGIRLVGGTGPRGRLEVSSLDSWFWDGSKRPSWSPVCDSDNFTDEDALTMCKMLTYSYGRKYYNPAIAYRKNNSNTWFVGNIECYENPSHPPRSPALPSQPPPPPTYSSGPSPSTPSSSTPSATATAAGRNRRRGNRQLNAEVDGLEGHQQALSHEGNHHNHHNRRLQRQEGHQTRRHLQQQQHQRDSARARSLFSPLRGTINTPRASPYRCSIKPGDCDAKGTFVGIECSHTPLVDAPPPPPTPPSPPPAPPALSLSIRAYGPDLTYYTKVVGPVEPNLYDEMLGDFYGRFDVQVEVNGSVVWAPLCAPPADADMMLRYVLGEIACNQVYDWPKPFDGGIGYVQSQLSEIPFSVPTGDFQPGDFDPSSYSYYAAVTGGDIMYARAVQDLELTLSTTPCPMLAVACLPYGERRRI